ncbi:Adaptive-response sensory-kinase SasA [Pseudomonas fluorescens]|uniref:histidine kinase n=1 Tax=Pseudomonas fluorescens TaxID=294 RepID=A0A5E7R041_PSEFL|nr:HAMP domain-containing sensor histidine kinase [Pseudomonas fluorescens]VVP67832.1 Adaptive-response sensory-kinase SasA [Pseudomonas fluorescens]
MHATAALFRRLRRSSADSIAPTRQFNLLRWFSVASFLLIGVIAFGLGSVSTRFLVTESLERDALMSAQFIQTIAKGEIRHHGLAGMPFGDVQHLSRDMAHDRQRVRSEFLDYLTRLPDSLLISIYSPLRKVVWSTNSQLVGKQISNDELEEAFSAKDRVSTKYNQVDEERIEQKFFRAPKMFFIESYIPLVDDHGNIVAVVEIYREPLDLIDSLKRGHWIIWLSTMGGLLFYFGVYWIARRASLVLASQEDQVVANRTYGGLVELSTAVAHSLRNPLACIRSSAELAKDMDGQPAKKNIDDIVGQVDRMSQWVHELLLYLSPIRGEAQRVEPMAVVQATLNRFNLQLTQSRIQVEFDNQPTPRIISHPLLLSQLLNSVIANAIEAMPAGGQLSIHANVDQARQWLQLTIRDSGDGTSREQEMRAFKSFYTTRQGRLGIGLVMVRQIMENLGGEACLIRHEKQGTSVRLSFRVRE